MKHFKLCSTHNSIIERTKMVENIETTQEDIKSWVISGQIPTTDVS